MKKFKKLALSSFAMIGFALAVYAGNPPILIVSPTSVTHYVGAILELQITVQYVDHIYIRADGVYKDHITNWFHDLEDSFKYTETLTEVGTFDYEVEVIGKHGSDEKHTAVFVIPSFVNLSPGGYKSLPADFSRNVILAINNLSSLKS